MTRLRQGTPAVLAELLCLSTLLYALSLVLRARLHGDVLAWHFWGHVRADPIGILRVESEYLQTGLLFSAVALLLSYLLLRLFHGNIRRYRLSLAFLLSATPLIAGNLYTALTYLD